jgi:hypothetical protein
LTAEIALALAGEADVAVGESGHVRGAE